MPWGPGVNDDDDNDDAMTGGTRDMAVCYVCEGDDPTNWAVTGLSCGGG